MSHAFSVTVAEVGTDREMTLLVAAPSRTLAQQIALQITMRNTAWDGVRVNQVRRIYEVQ